MTYQFLLTLAVILFSTKLLSILASKIQLPQVVGSLLAGLLLGPSALGILQPSDFLSTLSELGVVLIMFTAGMGTSIKDLRSSGKAGFLVALIGVLLPLGMGAALMLWFDPSEGMMGAIFMGTVLTATSVSITVETLQEIGKLSTKVGNTILAAALIDDVLGLICLTLVTSMADAQVSLPMVLFKVFLFFIFAGVVGVLSSRFLNWYDSRVPERDLHRFPVLAFVLCLFMAWAGEVLFGVSDIIGAFAAGLVISTTSKQQYIQSKFSPLSYLLLSPIFFANFGLEMTLPTLSERLILFTILLLAVGLISKLVGCGLGAKLCGFTNRQCTQIGLGMVCRGEVALIVANKGMDMGVIGQDYFGPIIILIIACSVLTPVLLKVAFRGEDRYAGLQESPLVDKLQLQSQVDVVTARLIRQDAEKRSPKKKA